jgi:hypothetical protein
MTGIRPDHNANTTNQNKLARVYCGLADPKQTMLHNRIAIGAMTILVCNNRGILLLTGYYRIVGYIGLIC